MRGIQAGEIDALLQFHGQMYGVDSYQASRRYFDWLYLDNPTSRGVVDCTVALQEDSIVGCVHRMRLPCSTHAGPTTLASLQNHVVSPKLRGGAGVMLLQRAVKGETCTLSPGVSGRLSEAYRRLGYSELPSYWLMRILNPFKAATQSAARKLSHGRWPSRRLTLSGKRIKHLGARDLHVTLEPTAEQLLRLADGLLTQARQQAGAQVNWTTELLRWRFFSPDGPRHVLIEKPSKGAWGVLSYGVKSRINVARLIEYEPASDRSFMGDILKVARQIGAGVALAYTTRPTVRDQLVAARWRPRADAPSSFTSGSDALSVSGAATDVGFEALLTRQTP